MLCYVMYCDVMCSPEGAALSDKIAELERGKEAWVQEKLLLKKTIAALQVLPLPSFQHPTDISLNFDFISPERGGRAAAPS